MSVTISLSTLAQELDVLPDGFVLYLNKRTGESILVSDEDRLLLNHPEYLDNAPNWRQEFITGFIESRDAGDLVELPSRYEIHKRSIMRRFTLSITDPHSIARLENSLHGRGAYKRFKTTLFDLNLEEDWRRFLEATVIELLIPILDMHTIPYQRD